MLACILALDMVGTEKRLFGGGGELYCARSTVHGSYSKYLREQYVRGTGYQAGLYCVMTERILFLLLAMIGFSLPFVFH